MRRGAGNSRATGSRTARTCGCARCKSDTTCRRAWSAGSRPPASISRRKTCSPSLDTRGSILPCRPGAPSGRPATNATSSAASMRARIPRTERSPSASRPTSRGRSTMNIRNRTRLLYGIVGVVVAAGVTYACSNFLDQPAQGSVEVASLETKAGVEGSLIAAYRSLDCSSSSAGSWGCAASNWVWGSVPSGDAHKGSNAGDQQPINDIETYYWSVGEAEGYLNQKWSQVYDGVFRANATINLLAKVRASKPLEISDEDAASIRGEALFLRHRYGGGDRRRLPQAEQPGARFDREADHRRLEHRCHAIAGDAAQRRAGTRQQMDRLGVQGPGTGLRRRPHPRVVGLGGEDVALRAGQRPLPAGDELRPRVDRLSAISRRQGDDPRVSGVGAGRRAQRGELELGRTAEFPALGQPLRLPGVPPAARHPLRLLRRPPALAESCQLWRGGRGRSAVSAPAPRLEHPRPELRRRQ